MNVSEPSRRTDHGRILLFMSLLVTIFVYWPGLSGSWLFDDYPNIVDNPGVQPHAVSVSALARAALSSPASEFKRPLASLSFAANYLVSGLDPYSWKLVNLIIHLLNGLLVYLLAKMLLQATTTQGNPAGAHPVRDDLLQTDEEKASRTGCVPTRQWKGVGTAAALIAGGWMLLPINLTGVLYVVQREESLANLFVLLGLFGYVLSRRRMLREPSPAARKDWGWFGLCTASLVFFTALGATAKETAVMLPLYAFLIEWVVFRFRSDTSSRDWRLLGMFIVVLVLPLVVGLSWLVPQITSPGYWSTRDFTLGTRLLSEARAVVDYIAWTLLPTPHALSFYHDQFPVSTGLLSPWTTLASILALAGLIVFALWQHNRRPLVSLGITLFLGCQLLTGTILPLELVYEHRNYFASFGLMLAVVPWLMGGVGAASAAMHRHKPIAAEAAPTKWEKWGIQGRQAVLAGLMLWWAGSTAVTAYAWGDPLRLAEALATRAPDSPRAQYELGRTYIIYSHYDSSSPYTKLAYAPLERAAAMPESSILPQQALIFMNARMHMPLKEAWWDSLTAKLKSRDPGVQDESSLQALTQCARDGSCSLPEKRMVQAFMAALDHPHPSARLQAVYGDYAWNVMDDRPLGLRMTEAAARTKPDEPAYHITLAHMLVAQGYSDEARRQIHALQTLNIGGRLDKSIAGLQALLPRQGLASPPTLQ